MAGRIRHVSSYERQLLSRGPWEICSTLAGTFDGPEALEESNPQWLAIDGLTTAAAALRSVGQWSATGHHRRFDAEDWWFRTRFRAAPANVQERLILGCDGIATVADIWLDGTRLGTTDNMFVAHEWPVETSQADHELVIRCHSLDAALRARRPRPRWRAPMIENQQLRWFRTTVLGRTPGWSPAAAAVGPWRDVWMERRRVVQVDQLRMSTKLDADIGTFALSVDLVPLSGEIGSCELILQGATGKHQTTLQLSDYHALGRIVIERPALWWPHTHGEPNLYRATLIVHTSAGRIDIDLGPVAFRSIDVRTQEGRFDVSVNSVPVFCRGACWTPLDPVSLTSDPSAYASALDQVVAAGMNMLRVSGTMVYECEAFFDECDRRGILVWQDFMFANMDYPAADQAFDISVRTEISQQLERLQAHPSVAVLCGNSEVAQQAAMWGAERTLWAPPLFHEVLPSLCAEICPDAHYWPSSAWGGSFPHQPDHGTSSYYGVGAYLRALDDARRSEVRFASECLAFANVPEAKTIAAMPGGLALRVHHAAWKAATPRDLNAGWDFEDVRDHYLRTLFGVDPVALRYSDHDRYLDLSRVVSGEVMAAAFKEWRRGKSSCSGALIWFLRDLVEGAGWGIIDARGVPKAAYYIVRRALQPRAISISDEGVNGIRVHVSNDLSLPLQGTVLLQAYKSGALVLESTQDLELEAHRVREVPILDSIPGFHDLSFSYRFGPPLAELVVATLKLRDGTALSQDFYFPTGWLTEAQSGIALKARAEEASDKSYDLTIEASRSAQWVRIDVDHYTVSDQYFHLAPGAQRTVRLERLTNAPSRPQRCTVSALNVAETVTVDLA